MAEPYLKFIYNHSDNDAAYDFYSGSTGGSNWRQITPGVDTVIFTGGGIDDWNPFLIADETQMTLASGSRSPTIRPAVTSYVIPYIFVESGPTMYRVPSASRLDTPNTKAYAFGVSVSGTIEGQLYLEAWDDFSFSTYTSEVLTGSTNSSNESHVNAINTDAAKAGNGGTMPYPWNGGTTGGAYLRGSSDRVAFQGVGLTNITDEVVFFNVYIRLETDSVTFHNTPVFGFRYLYT